MIKYVAGLLFSNSGNRVVLIHKNRGPAIVVGRWNAVGGKVEPGESDEAAMRREFAEEAGVVVAWTRFLTLKNPEWEVAFFYAFDSEALESVRTKTNERVIQLMVGRALAADWPVVPNLRWIIPMALGHLDDNVAWYEVIEKGIL